MSVTDKKIAIIGAGLTGLSIGYLLSKHTIPFVILEKSDRVGGVIQTKSEQGFTYECGPNTGVLSTIEIEKLLKSLDLDVEIAHESAKHRWILKNSTWHPIPSGIISAITTPLFSFFDKIRILGEPFRKKGQTPNESIHEMVDRRLGKSFHDYAVAPFINGVYAGNTDELITRFALPKLYNLEQEFGSFVKGMVQKAKQYKKQGIELPSKKVFSCKGGLSGLIEALKKQIDSNIILGASNLRITKNTSGYTVNWYANEISNSQEYTHIISTCNVFELEHIFPDILQQHKDILKTQKYAPIVQVSVGFNDWNGISAKAFGGLIPPNEKRKILGVLFPSSMFNNKSPEGGLLLSVFMGGMLQPNTIELSEEEIVEIVKNELVDLLQIPEWNPTLIKIHKYSHAIAQYTIEMEKILYVIQEIEKLYPNLYIAGSIKDGIGMADRVKQAYNITEQIVG